MFHERKNWASTTESKVEKMAWYELHIKPDEDTWLVTSPDFDELVTYGTTKEEARRNGLNAIEEAIAARIAHNEDIPRPLFDTTGKGYFVEVPLTVLMKAAIYMIMRDQHMSRADLMRALGWHREQVDRLFRLDHQTKVDALQEVLTKLGHPPRIKVDFPQAA
jgi:antitoxin HicB